MSQILNAHVCLNHILPSRNAHTGRFLQHGLDNLGNTCFLNSILMCMFHDNKLAEKLLLRDIVIQIEHLNSDTGHGILRSFLKLWTEVWLSRDKEIRNCVDSFVRKFFVQIQNENSQFVFGQQQDAHQFLLYLIQVLDRESEACFEELGFDLTQTVQIRQHILDYKVSLRTSYQCSMSTNHTIVRNVTDMILLNIFDPRVKSVQDGLDLFFADEFFQCDCPNQVHNPNNRHCTKPFFCTSCNSYEDTTKSVQLNTLPQKLVLCLNRSRPDVIFIF